MRLTVEARERIVSLEAGGRLTPDAVVADAKDPESPLHGLFNWNLEEAAHEHWLDTARGLIVSVRTVVRHEKRVLSTVAYVRDPEAGAREQGYRSVASLRTERDLAEEALLAEIRRAVGVLKRVAEIAAALGLEVDLGMDQLISLSEEIRSREAA